MITSAAKFAKMKGLFSKLILWLSKLRATFMFFRIFIQVMIRQKKQENTLGAWF